MSIDEPQVRERAEALCDALVAGDVDRAIAAFSDELRRNLGEVLALLPLPASEATIESIERSGPGFNVVLRLIGEIDEARVQTRWKDRDGTPTVVEASHLSRATREATAEPTDEHGADETGAPADELEAGPTTA